MNYSEHTDTIAAPATAPGSGGVAIIRVSGENAESVLRALFVPAGRCDYTSHMMYYGHLVYRGETLDECFAVLMRAPRTYTREDVAELHLHGGEYTVSAVMDALCRSGVRAAEPGEFTRRAFLNGRIDLSRAEAVMQLISARGRTASQAALRQLSGTAGTFIQGVQTDLMALLAGIEAAIDYPDEIEESETAAAVAVKARELAEKLRSACDEQGAKALESGVDVVLCGMPNAGKSSLLNHLLGRDRAIVTEIPGTTRDIITESVYLEGIRFNLSDTAGIRDTDETIERIGIDLAEKALRQADVILHLIDSASPDTSDNAAIRQMIGELPCITLYTKHDLHPSYHPADPSALPLSVRTGEGIPELIKRLLSYAGRRGETPLTELRHMSLAREAADALESAALSAASGAGIDLCAVDLQQALHLLGGITGEDVSESLLDTIFSNFCVGK